MSDTKRKTRVATYDPACWDVAAHFLSDESPTSAEADCERIHILAGHVQQTIEDWLTANPPSYRG